MRSILLTDTMLSDARGYAKRLFTDRDNRFIQPDVKLQALIDDYSAAGQPAGYISYLKKVKQCRLALNALHPDKFEDVHNRYFNSNTLNLSAKFRRGNVEKSFADWVVWALRFEDVRHEPYLLKHFHELGIKSCVYCNAQFAVTIDKASGKYIGHYDLDHNLPKAKYPFLATNFFNLVPCCGHCNSTKNNADIRFRLYLTDEQNLEPLCFEIDESKLVRYLTTLDCDDIDVHLKDLQRYPAGVKTMAEIFNERFHIDSLCKEHRDVIEELLWKYKIYNQSYISMLEQQFSLLFPNDVNFNRFLLGNYDRPEDIHKRPLAKLIQDIARQLDMIM